MYKLEATSRFKKSFKKLSEYQKILSRKIITSLQNRQKLERKHKDHALTGELKEYRECHILPDLLLIYRYKDDVLVLNLFAIGSHSELF